MSPKNDRNTTQLATLGERLEECKENDSLPSKTEKFLEGTDDEFTEFNMHRLALVKTDFVDGADIMTVATLDEVTDEATNITTTFVRPYLPSDAEPKLIKDIAIEISLKNKTEPKTTDKQKIRQRFVKRFSANAKAALSDKYLATLQQQMKDEHKTGRKRKSFVFCI